MPTPGERITPGSRMAIRTRIPGAEPPGPTLTDTVGEVVALDDETVVVRTRAGDVSLERALVTAARVIPPRPGRRGAPHRAITVEDLQRVMTKGNPGLEVGWLGRPGRGWMLRAAGGFTARANSALPLGDPGVPDDEAVAEVRSWYAERGLVPTIQLPLPLHVGWDDDPFARSLTEDGWGRSKEALVLTARLTDVPIPEGGGVEVSEVLTDEWVGAADPRAAEHGDVARAVLEASSGPRFLLAREGDEVVGAARASVGDGWTGVFSVRVRTERRERGLGRQLTAAAAATGAAEGASLVYLQVEEDNAPALALYRSMGFTEHHRYATFALAG